LWTRLAYLSLDTAHSWSSVDTNILTSTPSHGENTGSSPVGVTSTGDGRNGAADHHADYAQRSAVGLIQDAEFGWQDRPGRRFGPSWRIRIRGHAIAGCQFDMDFARLGGRRALRRRFFLESPPLQVMPLRFHGRQFTPIRQDGTYQC
jgi:hypothetical protein